MTTPDPTYLDLAPLLIATDQHAADEAAEHLAGLRSTNDEMREDIARDERAM